MNAKDARDQIAEVRSAQKGEMYTPDTSWRIQDNTPRPVPELDTSGNPWRITGAGRHVGTDRDGTPYCLEWLPVPDAPRHDFGPKEGLEWAEMVAGD